MTAAPQPVSLAELRAKLATVEPVFSAADRARRGTELEILAHVPALLDIAEAADWHRKRRAVSSARLDEALAKVRP